MIDTVFIHDTMRVIDTVHAQASSLDMMDKMSSFYSGSITFIVLFISILAPIAIGLVSYVAVWIQKRNYKLERENINVRIQDELKKARNEIFALKHELISKIDYSDSENRKLSIDQDCLLKQFTDLENETNLGFRFADVQLQFHALEYSEAITLIDYALSFCDNFKPVNDYNFQLLQILDKCIGHIIKDNMSKGTVMSLIKTLNSLVLKWTESNDTNNLKRTTIKIATITIRKLNDILPHLKLEGIEILAAMATQQSQEDTN